MTYRVDVPEAARGTGMRRGIDLLARQMDSRQPVLGAFSLAGFPDYRYGVEALVAYAHNGATVLEVGVPTVNPWLDGPVIAAAHRDAMRAGHGVGATLRTVERVSALTGEPVVVMSYWATVKAHGPWRMAHELASAGAAGCLVPDVPAERVPDWAAAAADARISAPLLASREASPAELSAACRAATGFIYAPAAAGQRTGYLSGIDLDRLSSFVAMVRRAAPSTPVVSGIGVSTPAMAAAVVEQADVSGVVVGSPLVRAFNKGGVSSAAALVAEFVASMARPSGAAR
ncbi:tryptophan synthase subunit alpha [Streptomyces sp. DH12]|uniref:tryptophan synthase subunit alpha n=1 Tax=Streptomyces sp. DH12 TaxID=2857010 RepID=UPI001E447B20|nr:tryptophan synthase subunit alpha [Streptomyces sp. DH12]